MTNISLPQGVKDILPEEAERVRQVASGISSILEGYGFKRVITPLLEYLDVLSLGLEADLKDRVFKFVDPATGRIVAIRPDITPQVARVVASRMRDCPRPIKVWYDESVLRYPAQGGKPRELFQVGAEYIGSSSPEADAELIIIAIEVLKGLGLEDFKIDIGDVGFFKRLLKGLEIDKEIEARVREVVSIKDRSALEGLLPALVWRKGEEAGELLMELPALFGGRDVINRARGLVKGDISSALDNLDCILDIIEKKGYAGFVTVDLGEVRGFDYYTGVIFEGFARGVGKALLTGGRYDNLLERYGWPSPATGLAFDVENIIEGLERQ
ncbi:MAG: ATP phosphoribosyltransferase regulatory subunit [Deltaproteobacteria bacterium]|nr:ATP phosphoribosyltransferase regulatory subunit [Deltaproteobacteria bacterium]